MGSGIAEQRFQEMEASVTTWAQKLADSYSIRHTPGPFQGYSGVAKFNSENSLVCTVFWFISPEEEDTYFQTRLESLGYVSPSVLERVYEFVEHLQKAGLHPDGDPDPSARTRPVR